MNRSRFTIDALARTGSTSLANMLSSHPDISCLIEPFHPARYEGRYHRAVHDKESLRKVLDLIWLRWSAIKHVWQVPGQWPFSTDANINDELLVQSPAVISLERRNLLQRYVSSILSQKVRFWIGTRSEFINRLERVGLPDVSITAAKEAIDADRAAMTRRRRKLEKHPKALSIVYEDFFGEGVNQGMQLARVNEVLGFLGYPPLTEMDIRKDSWMRATDSTVSKWNGREIYERIPGIQLLEDKLGSDEFGWLFR